MPLQGRYLIDKDGTEYRFNEAMAAHTNLYAVMENGRRVPYQGTPSLKPSNEVTGVLAGDRMPSEAELLAARQLLARYDQQQGDDIAMQGLAEQTRRQAEQQRQQDHAQAARNVMGPTAPEDPAPFPVQLAANPDAVTADGSPEPEGVFDDNSNIPPAPPLPKPANPNLPKRAPPPPAPATR